MTNNILKSRGKFVYSMDVATSGAVMERPAALYYEVKFALATYSGFSVASGTYFYIRSHVLISGT
eukprot:scaffold385913_cov35-Attheya_sp.AAC.1